MSPPQLADRPERWPVSASETVLDTARVISVRQDRLRSPADGAEFVRDVVIHPGAVGVVALDDDERVLLVSQYRHPVGHRLFEVPAGLLDVPGEPYHLAAARELYEEGHVRADEWRVLVDLFTSPGMTTESTRVFLARGLTAVADVDRHVGVHEEADMPVSWAPLADVVDAVLGGRLHNPILVSGVLAAWSARSRGGYDALRPADAPWAARDAQAG
ncbi:MAG TPA: NUDIX hydrolase [Jiangellaceae bacterium]|nr:NUDIX hydrolase [Jiangellaceae bacterium]